MPVQAYRRYSTPPRSERSFPTRTPALAGLESAGARGEQMVLEAGRIYRYLLGLDETPRPLTAEETSTLLRDPFAELLLNRAIFPQSLRELLDALDRFNDRPGGLPDQGSFLVGDGSQITWSPSTVNVNRQLRFAITRGAGDDVALLVSTGLDIDSDEVFLQVLAWDEANQVFNFYQRIKPAWIWSGSSLDALVEPTRGRGPFDSHVNGSMVMKELKAPWIHWQSVRASIDAALAPDDPVRQEPLFKARRNAEVFQIDVVQPGIARWNQARIRRATSAAGTVADVPQLMRQVLETTTVNLVTSDSESHLVQPQDRVRLPITFFFNSDALIERIGLQPRIRRPAVSGQLYLESLQDYEFRLTDGEYSQPGDTHFAFLVPEPAFEDLDLLAKLLEAGIFDARFAACLLMVDFQNPVFSTRRGRLLHYAPETARMINGTCDLAEGMVRAIAEAAGAGPADSPEQEFLANWRLPESEWRSEFEARIERYLAAVFAQLETKPGFDAYTRLADSRRREFRRRPLAEFGLTMPTTKIPSDAPFLEMVEDGTVGPRAL